MKPSKKKKKGLAVNSSVWVMLGLAVIVSAIAYQRDPKLPFEGFKAGGLLFLDILPALVVGFILAGMISQVIPRELMTRWLGEESGLSGLLIATLAGSLTPGGPFVQFPIVAGLLKAGAGVAPLMAYILSLIHI